MKRVKLQAGFTLLEIMIAIVIVALAGSAIVNATGSHMRMLTLTEDSIVAAWVAENRLAELQLEEVWPPKNNKSGKEKIAGRDWFWRQEVKKVESENMRQVTVYVMTQEGSEDTVYHLQTYIGNKK